MAYGALLARPYQYELGNGMTALLMGAGTHFVQTKVEGLFDMPPTNDVDQPLTARHGGVAGLTLTKKKIITLTIDLVVEDTLPYLSSVQPQTESDINLLRRWFQTTTSDLGFSFRRPGTVDQIVYCRPMRRSLPSDADLALGHGQAICELHANNPMVYSLLQYVQTATITNLSTQASTPVFKPAGEFPSELVTLTLTGPAAGPILITNSADSNRTIRLSNSLLAGDTMVIDVYNRNVLVNGVNQYGYIRSDNQWWRMMPQVNNTITVVRQTGAAPSTLTVAYQDAWQ